MKKSIFLLSAIFAFFCSTAQVRYTPPPAAIRPQIPNSYSTQIPTYYTVYLKDGSKFTGQGEFTGKGAKTALKIEYYGQKRKIVSAQTIKITSGKDSTLTELINYNDIGWLSKIHNKSNRYYQFWGDDSKCFIKDGNDYKELSKDEVFSVVAGEPELERLVKKDKIVQAVYRFLNKK